jgi:hypothetical protein
MVKKLFEADRPNQTTPVADNLPDGNSGDEEPHTTYSAATRKPPLFFSGKNLTCVRAFHFCVLFLVDV